MKTLQEIAEQDIEKQTVTEDLNAQYDNIIKLLQEAKENNQPIDEGLFGAIFGGIAGVTAGPAIMKAVAKALGIDERGAMYNLMTSKLVLGSMGTVLGWKV